MIECMEYYDENWHRIMPSNLYDDEPVVLCTNTTESTFFDNEPVIEEETTSDEEPSFVDEVIETVKSYTSPIVSFVTRGKQLWNQIFGKEEISLTGLFSSAMSLLSCF